MNVLYAISSHVKYESAVKLLLDSMPPEVVRDRTVVVVGGAESYERRGESCRGPQYRHVAHNSYDLTALIELLERPLAGFSHVFLLHDTMKFGPRTHDLVSSASPEKRVTAVWEGQCNLMLLRYDYIIEAREYILSQKDCSKLQAINDEGHLFRRLPAEFIATYPGELTVQTECTPYGTTPRIAEYYSGVDLTKYKANWGQTHAGTFVLEP